MNSRLGLIREILWKPIWLIFTILWVAIGNIQQIIQLLTDLGVKTDSIRNTITNSDGIQYVVGNWIALLVIIFAIAIAEGFYRKAKPYLADQFEAKVNLVAFARQGEGYASIKVHNDEDKSIFEPELSYLGIYLLNANLLIPKKDEINGGNANISWWIGGGDKSKIREKNYSVFNLAKQGGDLLEFIFDDGTVVKANPGIYKIEVGFNGLLSGNVRINPVKKTFYLEYFTQLIEKIEAYDDDGSPLKRLYKASFIDIREGLEKSGVISPSGQVQADMNTMFRYMAKGKE